MEHRRYEIVSPIGEPGTHYLHGPGIDEDEGDPLVDALRGMDAGQRHSVIKLLNMAYETGAYYAKLEVRNALGV